MKPDKEYFSTLAQIALPIIIQSLIMSGLNMIDMIMVGQLGETTVASVGIGNQYVFILLLLVFGITNGASVFAAQFWGKRDLSGIHKVLWLGLSLSLFASLIFSLIALAFPQFAIGIYSRDPEVIKLGGQYLGILGLSFLPMAISNNFISILRSTGDVRIPTAISILAALLKTLLNYILIFGNLGVPQLGVTGAALATTGARGLECLLLIIYSLSHSSVVAHPRVLRSISSSFYQLFMKTALPVIVNETLWGVGASTFNLIYARISTESVAATSITGTVDQLAFVSFFGLINAAAVMIGHRIGAGEDQKARDYARWTLVINIILAILVGLILVVISNLILELYQVSPIVRDYAQNILKIIGIILWVRVVNTTIIIAILRSGGDTQYAAMIEITTMYFVGLPAAALGAFVFDLPVYWVYLLAMSDEITKLILAGLRFRSLKWLRNLVRAT